jgi:hypothetical protein
MSVVVNEFDVVPAAPPSEPAPAPTTAPEPTRRLTPDAMAGVERALRVRMDRQRRLEAD